MNGIFLLALGAAWNEARLAPVPRAIAYWTALYGAYVNWLITVLAAIFGTAALSPTIGAGHSGKPWQETFVTVSFLSVGVAIIVCAILMLWGFRTKARASS